VHERIADDSKKEAEKIKTI